MKKKIFVILQILLCYNIACNTDSNKVRSNLSDTMIVSSTHSSVDSNQNIIAKKAELSDKLDISIVVSRMRDKKELAEEDYIALDDFLLRNTDESKSEEVGYTLFEYLRKNKSKNNSFLQHLSKKEKAFKDAIMKELIQIMCIDLGEENYLYENFLNDFELFKNSVSAKKAFKACMDNQVE